MSTKRRDLAAGRVDGEHREVGTEAAVARVPLRPLLRGARLAPPVIDESLHVGQARRLVELGAPRHQLEAGGRRDGPAPARWAGRATSRNRRTGSKPARAASVARSRWSSATSSCTSVVQRRVEPDRHLGGRVGASSRRAACRCPGGGGSGAHRPSTTRGCASRSPGIALSQAKATSSRPSHTKVGVRLRVRPDRLPLVGQVLQLVGLTALGQPPRSRPAERPTRESSSQDGGAQRRSTMRTILALPSRSHGALSHARRDRARPPRR